MEIRAKGNWQKNNFSHFSYANISPAQLHSTVHSIYRKIPFPTAQGARKNEKKFVRLGKNYVAHGISKVFLSFGFPVFVVFACNNTNGIVD